MEQNILKEEKRTSVSVIAIWYAFSNMLIQGLAILTAPIFSRILSKGEYGQFSNFVTWESVLTIIVSLQLSATIPRAKQDFPEKEDKYITSMIFIGNLLVLSLILLIEIMPAIFTEMMDMEKKYIRILLLSLFFSPTFTLWQTNLRMAMKYKSFVLFSILSAVSGTILSVVLVMYMENKFEARLYGYIIPKTIINIGLWFYIWLKTRSVSRKYILYAIPIAIPLMLNALAGNILSSSDRIMITNIKGAEETAMYTMGCSCVSIVSILWTSLNQAWTPWLFDKLRLKEYENIRNKSKIYILIFGIVMMLAVLIVPEMLLILGGKQYYEARYVVPPVLGGVFCQLIYGLYINLEIYMKKTYMLIWGTVLAAIINVLLNLFWIPRVGYIAASYTTLFGYFVMVIFHYINVYKYKEYREIYDSRFVFGTMLLVFLYQMFCTWLYAYNMLRYSMIFLCFLGAVILLIIKREKIKIILTNLNIN